MDGHDDFERHAAAWTREIREACEFFGDDLDDPYARDHSGPGSVGYGRICRDADQRSS